MKLTINDPSDKMPGPRSDMLPSRRLKFSSTEANYNQKWGQEQGVYIPTCHDKAAARIVFHL